MYSDLKRYMPTGLPTLDPVFGGGVPPGSVILLKGEIGSGKVEFAYTSLINLSLKMPGNPALDYSIIIPSEIRYVTVSKMSGDILREIGDSFSPDLLKNLDKVQFDDLSDIYFDSSLVPISWYSDYDDIIERMERRRKVHDNILTTFADILSYVPKESLIILDSLTEIATQHIAAGTWPDMTAFLRGLQRVAKKWNTTIYLILTKGILNQWQEIEVADAVDAVIHFKWEESSTAKRQRSLYIEKFRGVLIHLEEREMVKFAVKVTPGRGFEVSNIRVIL